MGGGGRAESTGWCPHKRRTGKPRHRDTDGRPCADGDRDQSIAAASLAAPRTAGGPQELAEKPGQTPPQGLRKEAALPTPRSWTSGLQTVRESVRVAPSFQVMAIGPETGFLPSPEVGPVCPPGPGSQVGRTGWRQAPHGTGLKVVASGLGARGAGPLGLAPGCTCSSKF